MDELKKFPIRLQGLFLCGASCFFFKDAGDNLQWLLCSKAVESRSPKKENILIYIFHFRVPYYDLYSYYNENPDVKFIEFLKKAVEEPAICKESILFALAAATLPLPSICKMTTKKLEALSSAAYAAVTDICISSNDFFEFLYFRNIISFTTNRNCAAGKGMQKMVKRWYMNKKPNDLLMEVLRCKSAYGWNHNAAITWAHLKLSDFSAESQAVLNFVYHGYDKTKENYANNNDAKPILSIMKELVIKNSDDLENKFIKRSKFIESQFKSLALEDIPTALYSSTKLWKLFIKHTTDYEVVKAMNTTNILKLAAKDKSLCELIKNRVKPISEVHPVELLIASNKLRKYGVMKKEESATKEGEEQIKPKYMTDDVSELCETFNIAIVNSIKTLTSKPESSANIYFGGSSPTNSYLRVVTPNSVGVGGRGEIYPEKCGLHVHQIATYIAFVLSAGGQDWSKTKTFLCKESNGFKEIKNGTDSRFHVLQGLLKHNKENRNVEKFIAEAFRHAIFDEKDTCILVIDKTSDQIIKATVDLVKQEKKNSTKIPRLIVYSPVNDVDTDPHDYDLDEIFFVTKFHYTTGHLIEAINNRRLDVKCKAEGDKPKTLKELGVDSKGWDMPS